MIPLRSNEKKPFWFCFAINFCLGLNFILSRSLADALFLKVIGADSLPIMFVVNAVTVILLFFVYDHFSERINSDNVFYILSLCVGALLVPAAFFLIGGNPPRIIYPILLNVSFICATFFYIHYYNYLIDFFDTLQTKRLLPFIFSGIIIGTIVGGFTLPLFLKIAGGTSFMIVIWLLLLGIICVLVFFNRGNRTLKKVAESGGGQEGFIVGFKKNILTIRKSRFIQITLLAYFVGDLAISGANIVSQTYFANSPRFQDAAELTEFYGLIGGWAAVLTLSLQALILPRLIRYWGVVTLNLILPILFLLSIAGMACGVFLPFLMMPAAVFTRFNVASAAEYLEPVASNLILSALSPTHKKRMLAFYGGFAEPIGPIIIGLSITALTATFDITYLTFIFVFFAAGYLILSMKQNHYYTKELVNLLHGQNFDLFKAASEGMANVDHDVSDALFLKLDSDDEDEAVISAQIIANMKGAAVIPDFIKLMPSVSQGLQGAFLNIFADFGLSAKTDPIILDTVIEFISHKNPDLRQSALFALDSLDQENSFAKKVFPLLQDSDTKTACLAGVYLLNRNVPEDYHERAMEVIKSKLSQDRQTSLTAIRTLSGLRNDSVPIIQWIMLMLKERQAIQKEVAKILQSLFKRAEDLEHWKLFIHEIRNELRHPIREVRHFALKVLDKLGELGEKELIISMGDRFEKNRTFSRKALFEMNIFEGMSADQVRNLWTGHYNRFRWESALFLEASFRTEKKCGEITELIQIALQQAGKMLSQLVCLEKHCKDCDDFLLLQGIVKDQFSFALKTSIRLVEYIGKDDAFAVIRKSLESQNPRLQADAIETLENLPSKEVVNITLLLEPLIRKLPSEEKMELLRRVGFFPVYNLEDVFGFCLGNEDAWEKSLTLHAIKSAKKQGQELSQGFSTRLASSMGFKFLENRLYTAELVNNVIESEHFDPLKIVSEGTDGIKLELFEDLEKNLFSDDEDKAIVSAQILADTLGAKLLPLLFKAVENGTNNFRSAILEIFTRIGEQEDIAQQALPIVLEMMDAIPEIRKECIIAIDAVDKDGGALEKITILIQDTDIKISSIAALYLLNRHQARSFHDQCINMLSDIFRSANRASVLVVSRNLLRLRNDSPYIIQWLLMLINELKSCQKDVIKILQSLFEKSETLNYWRPFLPLIRKELSSPVRDVRAFAFGVLKRFDVLTEKELVISLGDNFEKLRRLAQDVASEKEIFKSIGKTQIKTLWEENYNRFLWSSLMLLTAEIKQPKRKEILSLAEMAIIKAGTIFSYLNYITTKYPKDDGFLLLKTVLNDHFCFAMKTAYEVFSMINKKEADQARIKSYTLTEAEIKDMFQGKKLKGIEKIKTIVILFYSKMQDSQKLEYFKLIYMLDEPLLQDVLGACIGSEESWEKEITLYAFKAAKARGNVFSKGFESKMKKMSGGY